MNIRKNRSDTSITIRDAQSLNVRLNQGMIHVHSDEFTIHISFDEINALIERIQKAIYAYSPAPIKERIPS